MHFVSKRFLPSLRFREPHDATTQRRARTGSVLIAVALGVTACGKSDETPSDDVDASGPDAPEGAGGDESPGPSTPASGGAGAEGPSGAGANPSPGAGAAAGAGGVPAEPQGPDPEPDSDVPSESSVDEPAEPVSDFIVVDQFGYRSDAEKIAVVRDPEVGADAGESFTPGATYRVIDAVNGETAFAGSTTPWNGGQTHEASGDKAHWFDFSELSTPGVYYVLDVDNAVRSDTFRIASDVYREVLKQAVRTFFYQRAGFAKEAPHAEPDWVDGASHLGPLQDAEARRYDAPDDATTARDLSGGWYDAGDYNKYTAWTADYVVSLLRAYTERPSAFGDDYELPDSGNGVADIVDEARFGLEHLVRLQEDDGGVLSIVGLDHGSPPSSADGPSLYGPATANASLRAARAFGWGARVFAEVDAGFASDLAERGRAAYDWARANPAAIFRNNEGAAAGIGAGQQELAADAWEREVYAVGAALSLYQATGDASLREAFEQEYRVEGFSFFNGWLSGWNLDFTDTYLDYAALDDANAEIRSDIVTSFNQVLGSNDNLGMLRSNPDPYLAHQTDYVWGSNAQKARIGSLFYLYEVHPELDESRRADARRAAERYVHYLHGVNPFGLVYLSAMERFGAHRSVTQFYHSWFGDETPWDTNPAPGFLTGGPNASYDWDGQCPGHSACPSEVPSPPFGQPAMKSYLDFNTNWPVNSWSVTENSNGYQVEYIRLLSKFVD